MAANLYRWLPHWCLFANEAIEYGDFQISIGGGSDPVHHLIACIILVIQLHRRPRFGRRYELIVWILAHSATPFSFAPFGARMPLIGIRRACRKCVRHFQDGRASNNLSARHRWAQGNIHSPRGRVSRGLVAGSGGLRGGRRLFRHLRVSHHQNNSWGGR